VTPISFTDSGLTTFMFWKLGMYLETGSSSESFPSSTSRMAATAVIGFVIEKHLKSVFDRTGVPCSTSAQPCRSR